MFTWDIWGSVVSSLHSLACPPNGAAVHENEGDQNRRMPHSLLFVMLAWGQSTLVCCGYHAGISFTSFQATLRRADVKAVFMLGCRDCCTLKHMGGLHLYTVLASLLELGTITSTSFLDLGCFANLATFNNTIIELRVIPSINAFLRRDNHVLPEWTNTSSISSRTSTCYFSTRTTGTTISRQSILCCCRLALALTFPLSSKSS